MKAVRSLWNESGQRDKVDIAFRSISLLLLLALACPCSARPDSPARAKWGNAFYVDLAVGDRFKYLDRQVELLSNRGNYCTIRAGNVMVKNSPYGIKTQ